MMFSWLTHPPLFELARQAKRLPPVWAVLPLALVFMFASQLGVLPILIGMGLLYGFSADGISAAGQSALVSGFWMALTLIFSFGLMFFILWLWTKFYEKRSFASLGYEIGGAARQYGRGLLFGALLFGGAVGLLAIFGCAAPETGGDPALEGLAALGGVLIVFLGWMVQGASEEILTRGWVLPVLGARYGPWVGILGSALFFAAMHGLNANLSGLALVNLALFGLFAAFYALREGSLWGISALHSVWNWIQGNFFGFEVSGSSFGGGMLLNLRTTGPDWFTGGAFGPEGGLAVTIVLLIGIAVIFFWRPNHE
ncbi:MAG: CPBP family intramembrane metalloprotease domain-containing protein [Anaerolineae bacterium CG_4_9_14_3_um_filter_57_17]|nr:CPBP family intramembrane metalloprotease [bacterium]NCT20850.1 CPBP family intramembrane metalloprotease [bacterium]OIO84450.1 MAG: abortive infection protein [Anaerolineae bacterium CG2_30_57_67]PJB65242.1 MAG: CPBP family intramembrane metalloprotease domain-containing protein [Anaerolineae bacterium CG_4_9_14_3_um_filter_57_17]